MPKKKKKEIPKGYDSRFEYDLHKNQLKNWTYHPEERIQYEIPYTYEPDFVRETAGKELLVEAKGRFRTREEATKYIYIRNAIEEANKSQERGKEKELIFLFQDSNKAMPFVRKRKDGTKQTMGEWAEKNGFRFWCVKKGLPKRLC